MDESSLAPQACQRCWRRKQKCDRLTPQCSNCARVDATCVPRVWGRAVSTAPGEMHPEQQSGSFVERLKQRISFLESQAASNSGGDSALNNSTPQQASTVDVTASGNVDAGEDEGHSEHNNAPEVEYLSLTAMSGTDAHESDAQQRPFLAMFVQSVLKMPGTNPAVTSVSSTGAFEATSAASMAVLYDIDQRTLVQACQQLSVMGVDYAAESTDIQAAHTFLEAQNPITSAMALQQSPEDIVIACVIIAIALMQTARPHDAASVLPHLAQIVKDANSTLSAQGSDLHQVRCLALQAVLSMYHPAASSCWYIIGLAATKAISMGLHRGHSVTNEEASSKPGSPHFWTIYVLDRTLAFNMDRPFSLEDTDITLDPPRMPGDLQQLTLDATIETLRNWIVPYMQMLSEWRREPRLDSKARFASYCYWRATYTELANCVETRLEDEDAQHAADLMAFIRTQESQLSCRALLQLVDIACIEHPMCENSHELQTSVILEVPRFISQLENYVQKHNSGLNFVGAYDVVGATLLHFYCQYSMPAFPRIAVSDLKLLMTCIEILQTVAERFPPIKAFKEVLWKFLAALESGSDEGLLTHIGLCELPVPGHFMRLMNSCLKARRGVAR